MWKKAFKGAAIGFGSGLLVVFGIMTLGHVLRFLAENFTVAQVMAGILLTVTTILGAVFSFLPDFTTTTGPG